MLRFTDHTLPIADRDTRESPVKEIVKQLKEFGVEAYGYDPLLSKEEIEGFGVRALDDMLQITDYCPKGARMVLLWHWGMINKDFLYPLQIRG